MHVVFVADEVLPPASSGSSTDGKCRPGSEKIDAGDINERQNKVRDGKMRMEILYCLTAAPTINVQFTSGIMSVKRLAKRAKISLRM